MRNSWIVCPQSSKISYFWSDQQLDFNGGMLGNRFASGYDKPVRRSRFGSSKGLSVRTPFTFWSRRRRSWHPVRWCAASRGARPASCSKNFPGWNNVTGGVPFGHAATFAPLWGRWPKRWSRNIWSIALSPILVVTLRLNPRRVVRSTHIRTFSSLLKGYVCVRCWCPTYLVATDCIDSKLRRCC